MTEYLGALAARLAIPGLPDWTGLVLLLLVALAVLAFLLMPFSVFGVKGRLEAMEMQLDELRAELRALPMRLNDAPRGRARSVEEDWVEPPTPARNAAPAPRTSPPVPPPPAWPEARATRAEPKLDWPPRR
jgi:hypothetical protein